MSDYTMPTPKDVAVEIEKMAALFQECVAAEDHGFASKCLGAIDNLKAMYELAVWASVSRPNVVCK